MSDASRYLSELRDYLPSVAPPEVGQAFAVALDCLERAAGAGLPRFETELAHMRALIAPPRTRERWDAAAGAGDGSWFMRTASDSSTPSGSVDILCRNPACAGRFAAPPAVIDDLAECPSCKFRR